MADGYNTAFIYKKSSYIVIYHTRFSILSFYSANDVAVFQLQQAHGPRPGDAGRRGRGPTDVTPIRQQNSVHGGDYGCVD